MKRLTKKINENYCSQSGDFYDLYNKLGQFEDVEEECNIDIIKSVELCKKVNKQKFVYTKENWGVAKLEVLDDLDVELFHHRLYSNSRGIYINLDINDYRQYWALTREELENE